MSTISVRLDSNDKHLFEEFCNDVGMSISTAVNMFVKNVITNQKLPFNVERDPFYSEENMNHLKKYNVIILTECNYEEVINIDNFCRKNKIFLIVCDIFGAAGRIINDFGQEFTVNDIDGEDPKEIMLKD